MQKYQVRLGDFVVIQRHYKILTLLFPCSVSFIFRFYLLLKPKKNMQIIQNHKKIIFIINL